ncbi:deleted in malignant brain tumors 1 protein-like [Carcharodon carcharias]|uniref:deleted in malignant brain tumors 1 protein-like n=1 Tax=Carcharodon carcharias TaxID=13397 RepID=UPI001B7DA49F|nr:deleted in malignant brain tumors 1 protein-like [Carcharodon carcharias]
MLRSFLTLTALQVLNCRTGSSQADPSEAAKLRLVDGDSRCAGRVEILHRGKWGTVYDNIWDLKDAAVVCRELGCGTALSAPLSAHFGEGSGPVVMHNVRCSGNEATLRECRSYYWDDHSSSLSHKKDASAVCSESHGTRLVGGEDRCSGRVEVLHGEQWGTLCDVHFGLEDASVVYESWSLRLTNGGSRCDGRVEIYHNGRWGRVQDSIWELNDSNVVCRQLGCGVAIAGYNVSKYGVSEGPVWVNDIQCEGNELHLRNCSSFAMNSSLNESIDVGVLCSEHQQLRLSDSGSPCAGRLEIYYNGTWGSVCDDSWDLTDADVVCKQLHCGKALDVTLPASCGPGSGPVWLEGFNCSGEESFLWQCPSAYWGSHDCTHKEDVKIMCSEHKELRLVNGKHRCEGRAEVFYNGTWGTVCSEALNSHDAEVICKQLQCGPLDSIDYTARSFGEGSGTIWLDEMECKFHESTIWQCQTDPWGQHNCYHTEDAGVFCTVTGGKITKGQAGSEKECGRKSDSVIGLRLVGGNTKCSGRVELLSNNTWSTVCDDSWDMADANVVCRQLGCGSALLAKGGSAFGQGEGEIWSEEVRCTGSESLLPDCPSSASAQPDCGHKEDASVICSGPDLSSTASPSTLTGHEDEITSIPLVIAITQGTLLICEFIALIVLMRRQSSRKGSATGGWGLLMGLHEAIYEKIQDIPSVRDPARTRGPGKRYGQI